MKTTMNAKVNAFFPLASRGKEHPPQPLSSQRGFSLVSAIFLLVVLAGLGAAMVTFSTNQHHSSTLDILGSRAYQAARAGVEWSAFQSSPPQTALGALWAGCAAQGVATPVTTTWAVNTLAGTLAPFSVSIACTSTVHDEGARTAAGGNPVRIYRVIATASTGAIGIPDYVERQISVSIAQ